jgi:hypothetical protein
VLFFRKLVLSFHSNDRLRVPVPHSTERSNVACEVKVAAAGCSQLSAVFTRDLSRSERSNFCIMATNPKHPLQKVEVAGKGVGAFTKADVERRARELALIGNRTEPNDEDRAAALAELRDRHLPDAVNEDAESMQSMSRDPSDPMVDRGHQVPNYGGADEKAALEHLALEGVEEAQHEQMLESRNNIDEPLRSRPKRRQS